MRRAETLPIRVAQGKLSACRRGGRRTGGRVLGRGEASGDVGEFGLENGDGRGDRGGAALGGVEVGEKRREGVAVVRVIGGDQLFAAGDGGGDVLVGAAAKFGGAA